MTAVLTPRQHDVLRLYAAGHPRAEIGRRLGIAIGTVDVYIAKARNRLKFGSRREAAAALLEVRVGCVWRSNGLGLRRGDAVRQLKLRHSFHRFPSDQADERFRHFRFQIVLLPK